MDGSRPPTTVITLPPKQRVNIALALVAGALAVLVVITAHDTFVGQAGAATPAPTAITTPAPTDQAPAAPNGKPAKGKGHD